MSNCICLQVGLSAELGEPLGALEVGDVEEVADDPVEAHGDHDADALPAQQDAEDPGAEHAHGPHRAGADDQRYARRGEAVTFRFSPSNYKCITADGEKKYDYSDVTALYQDAAHYYLFRGRREGDILRRDGIDELGLDGFDAFLEEKTGQTLRAVK